MKKVIILSILFLLILFCLSRLSVMKGFLSNKKESFSSFDFTPPPNSIKNNNVSYSPQQQKMVDLIGPNYNYTDHIKTPQQMGVSSGSSVNNILKNGQALGSYIGYLAIGPGLGNSFWIKSGKCNNKSINRCKGKDRYIHINNIPSNTNPCLDQLGLSIPGDSLEGLIPSLFGDVIDISTIPIEMMGSLLTGDDSAFVCKMNTKKVGPSNKLQNQTRCSPPDKAVQCIPNL